MSAPEMTPTPTDAERQARELEAMLDDAAESLRRHGPVPAAEVRRALDALFAELDAEAAAE